MTTVAKFNVGLALLLMLFLAACSPSKFDSNNNTDSPSQSATGNPDTDRPPQASVAFNACAYARSVFGFLGLQLAPNGNITNVIGSVIYGATQVQSISDVKGSVIIVGNGSPNAVVNIQDLDGSVIVCGMNVSTVSNIRGSVIVVDGSVGGVSSVFGSLLVLDGQIAGPITNSIGSVLTVHTK